MEWVIDGARTRDIQDHNLALYQLSYDHRLGGRLFLRWPATLSRLQADRGRGGRRRRSRGLRKLFVRQNLLDMRREPSVRLGEPRRPANPQRVNAEPELPPHGRYAYEGHVAS